MKSLEEYKELNIEQRKKELYDYWNNLKPFDDNSYIPKLPFGDDPFFKNKLIELGAISKERIENDVWYFGSCRNSDLARWNSQTNKFDYYRNKFGMYFIDYINHFEDDNGFDLFVPLRKAKQEEIEHQQYLISIPKKGYMD